MILDEVMIRNEIRRLDKITGLNAAALPITFMNSRRILGQYRVGQKSFAFSNIYFKDENFPIEEQLDIIRHEYAHFLNHCRFNGKGHDKTWKQCCILVSARPVRLYDLDNCRYWREKHKQEESLSRELGALRTGTLVLHSVWGLGEVKAASGEGTNRVLQIDFEDVGQKRLSAKWVNEHCETEVVL